MARNREKEFWLEPSRGLAPGGAGELYDGIRPDVLLLERPSRSTLGAKIASRTPGGDILVIDHVDQLDTPKHEGTHLALEVTIRNREDHKKITAGMRTRPDYLIVDCPDWKIIPLENLVAEQGEEKGNSRTKIIARTRSYEESRTALGALELGVDGISLRSDDPEEAMKIRSLLSSTSESEIRLSTAVVESVRPIQMGARVCVDTTEIINPDEGLLVGCSSQALFLIEGEVHANPHVNPRPFRVNAGPVSLYVLAPDGKTRYLSDLQAGETVVLARRDGRTRSVDVARVKVERRPLVLVEARSGDGLVKTILQNAETIRLLGPKGSTPVHSLKPGDEVYVRLEQGGRHFGSLVEDEMIIEK